MGFNPVQSEQFKILPGQDHANKPIFSVLVKRTYDILPDRPLVRCQRTAPFVDVDRYWDHGDPQWATVQFENELVPYKPATDVVFIGKAHAPGGKPVAELDVAVQINDFQKTIRVFGNRRCRFRKKKPPVVTAPQVFTAMEIRYEKAYGGWDRISNPDLPFWYPRNPMGTGLAVKNIPEAVEGLKLPNLEDPNDLLTPERIILDEPEKWNRQPLPQGLGWYQKTWYPRCSFVGSIPGFVNVDDIMREERLGLVPSRQIALARRFKLPAFDSRFNNGASIGLARPYLNGDESIGLVHLVPEGRLHFTLPGECPAVMLDIGLGANTLSPVLQTVCIRALERQVDLIWQAAHEYPGQHWLPEMKTLRAEVC